MQISDEMQQKIIEVVELFDEAERTMKMIEHIDEKLIIPSVNELRYAGHHLAKAIKTSGQEEHGGEIEKAIKHCKRAFYDAAEVGILFYLEEFKIFQNDYRKTVLTDIIPNYSDLCRKADNSREMITQTPRDDRQIHYRNCETQFKELKEIVIQLGYYRSEINKKVKKEKFNTIAASFAIAGVIIAVILSFKDEMKTLFNSQPKAITQTQKQILPQSQSMTLNSKKPNLLTQKP